MKPIKFNTYIWLTKQKKRSYAFCSYCGKLIKKKHIDLEIHQPIMSGNIWLHFNCIDDFTKDIKNFAKKHQRDVLLNNLIEEL